MLDADISVLYGVPTKRLVEQMRRNRDRFPDDFVFQLTTAEFEALKSQTVISNDPGREAQQSLRSQIPTAKPGRGGHRYRPYAFTEQGVAMLSSVLRSRRAIEVNVAVMRAFVALRRFLADNAVLAKSSMNWNAKSSATMPPSARCSTPSASSWHRPKSQDAKSVFTRSPKCAPSSRARNPDRPARIRTQFHTRRCAPCANRFLEFKTTAWNGQHEKPIAVWKTFTEVPVEIQ